jgi:hypothetical protein
MVIMLEFYNSLSFSSSPVVISKNPLQSSSHWIEVIDGYSLMHKSGVFFGFPNQSITFVYGSLLIGFISKQEAAELNSLLYECSSKSIGFDITTDSGFDFGFKPVVRIENCRLQDIDSLDGIIIPRPGKMRFDVRIDYEANLTESMIRGTGVQR